MQSNPKRGLPQASHVTNADRYYQLASYDIYFYDIDISMKHHNIHNQRGYPYRVSC